MEQYIGLDVSLKETAISVRQNGKRIWRGKCPSDPQLLAEVIRKRAPNAMRVVFETGPLSVWFYHGLTAEGMPAICIDARGGMARWREKMAEAEDATVSPLKPQAVVRAFGRRLASDAVLASDSGQNTELAARHIDLRQGQAYYPQVGKENDVPPTRRSSRSSGLLRRAARSRGLVA